MLAISLRTGGYFEVDTGRGIVRVHIVGAGSNVVRLGVEAPRSMGVVRDRVLEKIQALRDGHLPGKVVHLATALED